MKKWLIGCGALLMLYWGDLLPFENLDPGQLCLVETLVVDADEESITLYSVDAQGTGKTVVQAVSDMENSAPGRLFLGQVKRIVFCRGAENWVEIMDLPEEIPLGAKLYCTAYGAEALVADMEGLERQLNARENLKGNGVTLAKAKNERLKEYEGK